MRAAVFLDRDGTINHDPGYISDPSQFDLFEGAAAAIKQLNQAGFLTVVVTNQSVIGRGKATAEGLRLIHDKMENMLELAGARVDRIYYCPHSPDVGDPCACRKPETGMMMQAQKDLNIDLTRSWMVGDSTADMLMAKRAGVKSVLVKTGIGGGDGKYTVTPDFTVPDLAAAVALILGA